MAHIQSLANDADVGAYLMQVRQNPYGEPEVQETLPFQDTIYFLRLSLLGSP